MDFLWVKPLYDASERRLRLVAGARKKILGRLMQMELSEKNELSIPTFKYACIRRVVKEGGDHGIIKLRNGKKKCKAPVLEEFLLERAQSNGFNRRLEMEVIDFLYSVDCI